MKILLPISSILILIASCTFISNTLTFKEKTSELVELLISNEYDKALDCFALEHPNANNLNLDSMKIGLSNFRQMVVENFGDQLEYSFMNSEKKISSIEEENTPTNTTVALIEISNDKEFGVLKVLFDDNSGKIMHINVLDVKKPIPSMTVFWIFGIIAICIPVFNIWVIVKIKRSQLKKKWLKYISVIFLNVPAISYLATNGLTFELLSFQIMLGFSFSYMGYLTASWTFGIPLGGLYWFWKLKNISE